MKTKPSFRKKAVEPLIAAILLIVVAVILVTIVLSWGKMFTTDATNKVKVAELTQSDAESFVYPNSLKNGILQFSYAPQGNFEDLTIGSYKVLSDSGETPDTNLSSTYTLKQGTNIISLTDFSKLGLEVNKKVTIILQTTSNQYISIKNITNNFTEAPVDLPYIMLYGKKLYIQPDQNTTTRTWANAITYCDNLDANGYDDWYLPSTTQLRAIWDTYTYQEEDDCLDEGQITITCINNTIYATNTNFVLLVSAYYWSSTKSAPVGAYGINMSSGRISDDDKDDPNYVRCVRGQ